MAAPPMTAAETLCELMNAQGPRMVGRRLVLALADTLFEMRKGELRAQCEADAEAILDRAVGNIGMKP